MKKKVNPEGSLMKYNSHKNRAQTDRLLSPSTEHRKYDGKLMSAVSTVEEAQLTDPALWALFVAQFRIGNVDDRDSGWRSEYWGKMMRGACFTYAYTQNETLYRVLEDSVRDMLSARDRLGRLTTYSVEKEFRGWDIWGRKYVMLGFQYFLEICKDDSLSEEILLALRGQADYIIEKIGSKAEGKRPITSTSSHWQGLNSSSILEPFVLLYNLTEDQKYLNFAKYIIKEGGCSDFNIFEAALEGKQYPFEFPVTKAYEMISNFEGILEYYRVTGEEKYKQMAINFARLVMESDITVIGCAGTTHELFDHSAVRQFDPAFDGIMQETCVTVTWMKYCHQLLCLTGDPIYADQIERSAYNALLGAVNWNHNTFKGQEFTFDSYSPLLNGVRGAMVGGYKDLIRKRFWWGCCVAIGAAGTGLIPMSAVMKSKKGIAVNLYLNGTYTQTVGDQTVTLHIETDYPKNGKISIRMETDNDCAFTLSMRIPSWSRRTALFVGGTSEKATSGTYAEIERVWKNGDEILLELDMRTKIIRAADIDPNAGENAICHFALQRGPVMLARDSALGEDVREPVEIEDENGYAILVPSETASFSAQQEYQVKMKNGTFTVVDYASAGQSWNPDLPMTVWITSDKK